MATGWGVDGWSDHTWGGDQNNISSVLASGAAGTVALGERTVAVTGAQAAGLAGTTPAVIAVALTGVTGRGTTGTPLYFYWTTIDNGQTPNWQNVEMIV